MCFVFFYERPDHNIPVGEIYYGPNASIIQFSVYNYQGRCETYVVTPNVPSVWILCEENNNINNGLIKRPTYGKKKHLNKMSCYIVELCKARYQTMLNKYAYHGILLCLLGKHYCKDLRR